MKYTVIVLVCWWNHFVLVENQKCGKSVQAENGLRLNAQPYQVSDVTGVGECTLKCINDPLCQSYNMRMSTFECMLLKDNHLNANLTNTDDDWLYMPNLVHPCYGIKCLNGGVCMRTGNETVSCAYTSCFSLLELNPGLRSGYYPLNLSGNVSLVYCEMETRGKLGIV